MIGIAAILGLLLAVGGIMAILSRDAISLRWLLIAAVLVALNDALLTRGYGLVPNLFSASDWNWQGKLLALGATLAIASLAAFGWTRTGFTIRQVSGSLKASVPVVLLYCAFFVALALAFPSGKPTGDEVAFQLTMPGLEEELFYRGILLFALDQAFRDRVRFLGVDWGWGAVVSCALFGLAHAFGFSNGSFSFDAMTMALTGIPSFIAVWLRLRTGSVALPVILHNFGNSISLLM